MPLRFAYTRPHDGGLNIVNAAPKDHLEDVFGPLTDALYRYIVIARSFPAHIDMPDVIELTSGWKWPDRDRLFRNAWRKRDGGKIEVDMPAARDVRREHMRWARQPLLAALDVVYMRADEVNDLATKAQIAKEKQTLRDITDHPDIEAAQTPDELRAVWPGVLGEEPPLEDAPGIILPISAPGSGDIPQPA